MDRGRSEAAAAEHAVMINGLAQRILSHVPGRSLEAGVIFARSALSFIERDILKI